MVSRPFIRLYFWHMKNLTRLALLLLSLLLFQSCAGLGFAKKGPSKVSSKARSSHSLKQENFDRKPFPNESFIISNMISIVQPELENKNRDKIATQISKAITRFNIKPQIMVAIIDTESNFKSDKVSSTGDLSLAQINAEVWNREFVRMKLPPINKAKLKTDQQYALIKMAEILSIIKKRYEKKDRRWYARYHSNTSTHKKGYLNKLEIRLKMLANTNNLSTKLAMNN